MKKSLISRLLVLATILTVLFSCRNEHLSEEETLNNAGKFQLTSKRISLNEAKHKTKLLPVLEKAEVEIKSNIKAEVKDKNAAGKVIDFGNGVSIDTDDVFYMEYGPYHTYTFRIKNDNAVPDAPVENLILSLEPDGTYKEMINTYSVTGEERERIRNGENFDFTGRISTRDIEKGTYAGSVLAKTAPGECTVTYELVQEKCGHGYYHTDPDTPECDAELKAKNYYIMHIVCDAGDTPGGSSGFPDGNGSGSSAPGGSSGTGQNNPIEEAQDELGGTITLPNLGFPNPREETPCQQLKKINENTNIKTKLNELKNNIGGNLEKGFMILDISGNETSDILMGNSDNTIDYPLTSDQYKPVQSKIYATAHNHNKDNPNQIDVFTPEDLFPLYVCGQIEIAYNQQNGTQKPVALVITEKGYFAIKIKDFLKLDSFLTWYLTGPIEERTEFVKDFKEEKKYNINPSASHDMQVIGFLRVMQDKDIGIELYEGNKDTFGDWKKLELIDNGNENYDINKTPCNL